MANLQISKEEMLKRVARFTQLAPSEYAFVDSKIPGHERLIYNVAPGSPARSATVGSDARGDERVVDAAGGPVGVPLQIPLHPKGGM